MTELTGETALIAVMALRALHVAGGDLEVAGAALRERLAAHPEDLWLAAAVPAALELLETTAITSDILGAADSPLRVHT